VAPSDTTVLIEGESGTGKEVVAAELHRQSPRRAGPYVIVDCAALTPSLAASELFGHERGAFTGADTAREGLFERARGGTVFLDEIGELPPEVQAALLRVLDTKVIRRVGSSAPRPVDVRLIAATNRDLAAEVKERRFRQDLFFRLAVVRVVVPPLRKRRGDIPGLARHFLWQAGCANPDGVLTSEVLEVLEGRRWPGNVRELRNVIERALLMQHGSSLPLGSVQQSISEEQTDRRAARRRPEAGGGGLLGALPPTFFAQPYKEAKRALVDEFESIYLRRLVELHGNNLYRLARCAGVDRQLIRRLLQKHGLGSA